MNTKNYNTHMALLDRKIEGAKGDSTVRIMPLRKEKILLTAQKLKEDAKRIGRSRMIVRWTPWSNKRGRSPA